MVGSTIVVRKKVVGSVFAAGSSISVTAPIMHALRLAGSQMDVSGEVGEDITAFGSSLNVHRDSVVNGDIHFVGGTLIVNGHVTGNITAAASSITINGTVDGNLNMASSNITVSDTAAVGGFMTYHSSNNAKIAPGVVKGAITKLAVDAPSRTSGSLLSFLMMIVSGAAIILLARHKIERLVHHRKTMPFADLVVGLTVAFLFPIPLIILYVSVIGIPLALVLTALYIIILYVAAIIASIFLGLLFIDWIKLNVSESSKPFVGLIIGVLLVYVLKMIPIAGGIILFFLTMYVLGLLVRYDIDLWHKLRHDKDV